MLVRGLVDHSVRIPHEASRSSKTIDRLTLKNANMGHADQLSSSASARYFLVAYHPLIDVALHKLIISAYSAWCSSYISFFAFLDSAEPFVSVPEGFTRV